MTEPTSIESGYIAQGYILPAHLTWADVHTARERFELSPISVPVASGPGVLAWGVPFINGKPMTH